MTKAATLPSAKTKLYSGTVTKAELRSAVPYDPYIDRYSPHSQTKDAYLLVAMETDDGESLWFFTPRTHHVVTCPPNSPIAVSIVIESPWIYKRRIKDGDGSKNVVGHMPQAAIKTGDRITIKARTKRASTRHGKQLFYVRRQED